jgi:hypothetical protein
MHYFLVYDDGQYTNHVNKLLNSVAKYGKQFKLVKFNKTQIHADFITYNQSIFNLRKGGGYWLWKPYIIDMLLKLIQDGDIVFYLDSKYYFVQDFAALYESYLQQNDFLIWKNKPNEPIFQMKNWCKMDVILKYNMYQKIFAENADDCWAGAFVLRKTARVCEIINEWLRMCCNYDDITDEPSKIKNTQDFREHRHDQSLLSIVLYKHQIPFHFFEKKYLQNERKPW